MDPVDSLLFECTTNVVLPLPLRFTADTVRMLSGWLVSNMAGSPSGLTITFGLNERLRAFSIPDEFIDESVVILGLEGEDERGLFNPAAHYANAFRLARLLATCAAKGWVTYGHPANHLEISLEYNDDGPGRTFYTFSLTVVADTAERERLMELGRPDE